MRVVRPASLARWTTTLCTIVVCAAVRAESETSSQLWADYNPSWSWPSGLQVYGDLGLRTELSDQGWVRFVARPYVRGPMGHGLGLAGGLGFFYTENDRDADTFEFRPSQGIYGTWPGSPVRLDHYARLEQRLEWETNNWMLDASLRFRYRLQTQFVWHGCARECTGVC